MSTWMDKHEAPRHQSSCLTRLPEEVLVMVLVRVPFTPTVLLNLKRTCRRFEHIMTSHERLICKRISARQFHDLAVLSSSPPKTFQSLSCMQERHQRIVDLVHHTRSRISVQQSQNDGEDWPRRLAVSLAIADVIADIAACKPESIEKVSEVVARVPEDAMVALRYAGARIAQCFSQTAKQGVDTLFALQIPNPYLGEVLDFMSLKCHGAFIEDLLVDDGILKVAEEWNKMDIDWPPLNSGTDPTKRHALSPDDQNALHDTYKKKSQSFGNLAIDYIEYTQFGDRIQTNWDGGFDYNCPEAWFFNVENLQWDDQIWNWSVINTQLLLARILRIEKEAGNPQKIMQILHAAHGEKYVRQVFRPPYHDVRPLLHSAEWELRVDQELLRGASALRRSLPDPEALLEAVGPTLVTLRDQLKRLAEEEANNDHVYLEFGTFV